MEVKPRLLAFAGSTRRDSYNKKLVRQAVMGAQAAGVEVTLIDLAEFPLPLFDEDLEKEQGLPANAQRLKTLFLSHAGFLIASPEYNSSISGVLKNVIDWVSRPVAGAANLAEFKGKIAALMSASPGALGGLRGLVHLRAILGNVGVLVLPDQVAIPEAFQAFDDSGKLKDIKKQEAVEKLGRDAAVLVRKINAES